MAATIQRLRALQGAGILATKSPSEISSDFLRYNLIYGFNGSGKSTLSRIFSCLQSGKLDGSLPEQCTFEIETTAGEIFEAPDRLSGIERSISVFNTDFIERNLQWERGTAASIFYISEEQAEAAAQLRIDETLLLSLRERSTSAEWSLDQHEKALMQVKRHQAKAIAERLNLGSRRYEAPQLAQDYGSFIEGDKFELSAEDQQSFESVAKRSSPPSALTSLSILDQDVVKLADTARHLVAVSAGKFVLDEIQAHPVMVTWIKRGVDYHESLDLDTCLLCGNELRDSRRAALTAAFDDGLSKLMDDLEISETLAVSQLTSILSVARSLPRPEDFTDTNQNSYRAVSATLGDSLSSLQNILESIVQALSTKRQSPTRPVDCYIPTPEFVAQVCDGIRQKLDDVNRLVSKHNEEVATFEEFQNTARNELKRFLLSQGQEEFFSCSRDVVAARSSLDAISKEIADVTARVSELRYKVRTHGPAAYVINDLVKKYLGHNELSIAAVDEGYELLRYGEIVTGPPSEGEKTAIALCYFLSTLEAEGRKLSEQILVIDDPISSLDTKAMNYACALLKTRLASAAQIFLFTHNQHCMNEFKKYWKPLAYPKNTNHSATARLLFLDVRVPSEGARRVSHLVELSKLLREYDSEYHFLCHKVLEFEKARNSYSDIGYLMPHVVRRVLELYLAFKVPGTDNIVGKIQLLCKHHPEIDVTRMVALERLSQVESHSDALEDVESHSSMSIEEARDANTALLELMSVSDPTHTAAIRRQCAAN